MKLPKNLPASDVDVKEELYAAAVWRTPSHHAELRIEFPEPWTYALAQEAALLEFAGLVGEDFREEWEFEGLEIFIGDEECSLEASPN